MPGRGALLLAVLLACPSSIAGAGAEDPGRLAATWLEAVREVNEAHARDPGATREADLRRRLDPAATKALERLLALPAGDGVGEALLTAGEAALDLDLMPEFSRARDRLLALSRPHADRLGDAVSRSRFLVRGLGGLARPYLERFADVVDLVLDAYDEVFGFGEWSKVAGKKLRFRAHLEPRIDRPPHFDPSPPFHSEVDFPVIDAERFASPTPQGQFLFYGLCHELGHVIAMWGRRDVEEDRHAWAHYCGVVIVEHLAARRPEPAALSGAKDVRWRSLEIERKALAKQAPGTGSRESVLALLVALHDAVGPRAIGDAIDLLDRRDKRLRVNRVRYYTFAELKAALLEGVKGAAARKQVQKLLP